MKTIPYLASKEVVLQAVKETDRLAAVLAIQSARLNEAPADKIKELFEAIAEVWHGDDMIEIFNFANQFK